MKRLLQSGKLIVASSAESTVGRKLTHSGSPQPCWPVSSNCSGPGGKATNHSVHPLSGNPVLYNQFGFLGRILKKPSIKYRGKRV